MPGWQDFKRELKASEGVVSHMYLDTVGKVTVGVGNMLPNSSAAQKLEFVDRKTRKRATPGEIKADFDAVSKRPKGLKATAYLPHTKLDLPPAAIDSLLDSRITEFKRELKLKLPKFEQFPLTAQFALLDMAFNLGMSGLFTKFPKFIKAVEAEDWAGAAKESNRPQVATSRNTTVKKWLEEAAKEKE